MTHRHLLGHIQRFCYMAPIAMNKPSKSVSVMFGPLVPEDNAIRATLGMASLIGSDDQAITILGGQILAVTREAE